MDNASKHPLQNSLATALVENGHRNMPCDEEEKDEGQRAVRVAKSAMKLPRHAGGGDGKHQRIQRQMPQLHFQAACGTAAQVAQRPNKAHRRKQQQQHANRLMRRNQEFQAAVEMPS